MKSFNANGLLYVPCGIIVVISAHFPKPRGMRYFVISVKYSEITHMIELCVCGITFVIDMHHNMSLVMIT